METLNFSFLLLENLAHEENQCILVIFSNKSHVDFPFIEYSLKRSVLISKKYIGQYSCNLRKYIIKLWS